MARELDPADPEGASIAAGRLVLERLDVLLQSRADFVYETTLASHQSIKLLRKAAELGYSTLLVFVALASPELHILRVAQRVSLGGHHIPEDAIRRRYVSSFDNLARAIPHCESVVVFDNSGGDGVRRVLTIFSGAITTHALQPGNAFDMRVAAVVATALGLSVADVMNSPR